MKITQLKQIQEALEAWSKKPSPFAYQVAKNIIFIRSVVVAADEGYAEAKKPFLELDSKGVPVPYFGNIFGAPLAPFSPEAVIPAGATQTVYKILDREGFDTVKSEYENDDHKIEFITIKESLITDEISKGNIEAEILVPLIGRIII